MPPKVQFPDRTRSAGLESPKLIPRSGILRLVSRIADLFHPEQIILYGSYAYGKPRPDSDVDLLVVMATDDESFQEERIEAAVRPRFRLQLRVCKPQELRWRLKEGDWYFFEIVAKGVVLYGKASALARWVRTRFGRDAVLGSRTRGESPKTMSTLTKSCLRLAQDSHCAVDRLAAVQPPLLDNAYGHCKEAIEMYFKALLQHWELYVPQTDNLGDLLLRLLPHDSSLESLRHGLDKLNDHAEVVGYPGARATLREFQFARGLMVRVQREVRSRLGLEKPHRGKST